MHDIDGQQGKYLVLREDGVNRIIVVFHALDEAKPDAGSG